MHKGCGLMSSLCETCDREVFFKCPWVMKGKAVTGWNAKFIKNKRGQFYTFQVISCPDYIKERERIRNCKICGRKLLPAQRDYCGATCAAVAAQRRYEEGKNRKNCVICGKPLPKNKQKFCSKKCYQISFNADARKRYRKKIAKET